MMLCSKSSLRSSIVKLFAYLTGCGFAMSASAQTVAFPIDSLWAPWSSTVVVTCFASLMDDHAKKLFDANVGTLTFKQSTIKTTFEAQSLPYTFRYVRLVCNQVGTNWRGTATLFAAPPAEVAVPAGKLVDINYAAGLSVGTLTITMRSP